MKKLLFITILSMFIISIFYANDNSNIIFDGNPKNDSIQNIKLDSVSFENKYPETFEDAEIWIENQFEPIEDIILNSKNLKVEEK